MLPERREAMRLLGFDTATRACSAALWAGGGVAAHRRIEAAERHAEALVPLLREVVAEGGAGLDAVDAFAVTVGPGSFTGIRIGLATARGLALAAGRPLIGLTTLEVLAAGVSERARTGPILAALDARRGRLYVQLFDRAARPLGEPCAAVAEALPGLLGARIGRGPFVVAGTGSQAAMAALPPAVEAHAVPGPGFPDARVLVRLAVTRAESAASADAPPRPLYLREPGARPPAGAAGL